jgi:predicted RNase H-like HicB family nuclease
MREPARPGTKDQNASNSENPGSSAIKSNDTHYSPEDAIPLQYPSSALPQLGSVWYAGTCCSSNRGRSSMRQVVLYRGEDGFWVAEVPSLPGCISQGRTREEALTNARDAIHGYVEALEADSLPVPPETFEAMIVAL